jgi:carboxyl-terminal processing protease
VIHVLLAASLAAQTPPAGDSAQMQLDAAIRIVKQNALWRDTVTWETVEAEVRALAADAQSAADVYPAIRVLLRRLGDRHSFVQTPATSRAFTTGAIQNRPPVVRLEPDSIGYLSVFGYGGGDPMATLAYARTMQDSLATMMSRGAQCRWIVDLRENTGGNMWPMLGGLRPFLGEAELGAFVGGAGPDRPWRARQGIPVVPSETLKKLETAYVAVLTGPRTASSGEAVTISFVARPRTRSFGSPTAGLSTANRGFRLPDGGMILLTVSLEADRTGRRYGGKVDPDEILSDDAATMARAREWLRSQPTCN